MQTTSFQNRLRLSSSLRGSVAIVALGISVACAPAGTGDDGGEPSPAGPATPSPTPDPEGPGAPPVQGVPPTISSVAAAQVGARGQSIQLTVEGGDEDGDISGIVVELLDSAGAAIALYDRDGDGEPDDPRRRLFLDPAPAGEVTVSGTAVMATILDTVPNVESVRVSLIDSEGTTSPSREATLTLQTEVPAGGSCDESYVLTRCPYGMGCAGSPATCSEGTAPEFDRVAYHRTSEGSQILLDGFEAEDDLKAIFLEFLDRSGDPVELDLDADGTPDSISFNVDVLGEAIDGRFLLRLEQTADFAETVVRIAATAVDDNGHTGERMEASLGNPPVRGFNQSCDPFGFDRCTTGAACSPDAGGAGHRCLVIGPMQSQMCESAPVVEPGETVVVTAAGGAFGASLWDPPDECAPNNPKNRPEGAVVLHLDEPAVGLRIRTDYAGTDFDTIVYVVEGCPREVEAPLGCDDDSGGGVFSDLDLAFVPAGDYLIVVDSYDITGGNFIITVELEE